MIKNFNILFSDTKNFMMNEVNRVFVLVIAMFIVFGIFLHFEITSLKKQSRENTAELLDLIDKTNKKIEHRYFNTTKSLEEIHKVKIDTKTGEIKVYN
ncbi:MAG: hypothetical protein VZR09_03765 [Candidatus Gastranaerophilaceae bacterium]|nr:hypothetical protein [Candidatus Gastranaerophilaceae bacterium]